MITTDAGAGLGAELRSVSNCTKATEIAAAGREEL
jgi:hypothetical protein